MFNDDLWAMLGIAGFGVSAYCYGKENGVKQTTTKYEMQSVVDKQQQQIHDLQRRLNDFERNNRFTNTNEVII